MLEAHGVDHLARSEHVGLQRGKSRSKEGSIGVSHAVQKGSGEGTAGFGEIPVLCGLLPVDGDHCGGSIVGMHCRHVPGRAGAELRWVALGNPGNVGDVAGDHIPHDVGDHKATRCRGPQGSEHQLCRVGDIGVGLGFRRPRARPRGGFEGHWRGSGKG